MNTFFSILQKHMNVKSVIYPNDLPEFWHHIFTKERDHDWRRNTPIHEKVVNMAFYGYIQCCHKIVSTMKYKNSYEYFDELARIKFDNLKCIIENDFLVNNRDYAMEIFNKSQKTYSGFSKLAQTFRIKKAKMQIITDLYMNPIGKNVRYMIIYQDGSKYMFKLSDLINIVTTALTNSNFFFAEALYPKNPYTNVEFSRGTLLEIYLQSRYSNFKMPELLYGFIKCEFNLDAFVYENEAIVRDMYIENYVKKSTPETLYEDVILMIKLLDRPKRLNIDKNFPKNKLVEIMRPYLLLYFIHEYSLSYTSKRNDAFLNLKLKFRQFVKYNPNFGRKIMKKMENSKKYISTFNFNAPNFYSEENEENDDSTMEYESDNNSNHESDVSE